MEVTAVRVRPFEGEGKALASVSVVFDEAFAVHDLRIVQGSKGLFVSMPSRRTAGGEYIDTAHPITAAMREHVQTAVLRSYHEVIGAGRKNWEGAELA